MKMLSAKEPSPLLSRLKFRVVQPVDIPRCHQLESLAYPEEVAASKQALQHRQHHAAPFFRCVLLKKPKQGSKKKDGIDFSSLEDGKQEINVNQDIQELQLDDPKSGSDRPPRKKSDDEACHHVHHSPSNELIGYICATRCHEAPTTEFNRSANDNSESSREEKWQYYPYATKNEPNGKYLAIHSIVVQKEYQRSGVAKALLEYYIKSISLYNAELDEAGINRRRNRIQAKKPDARIERILVLSYSSMSNLFVGVGFRWRATIKGGEDPLYELEREVESAPAPPQSADLPQVQAHPLMEQPCFIVDAFANHRQFGSSSGNPAGIVVLQDSPANLITDYYNSVDTELSHTISNECEASSTMSDIILSAKALQENEKLAEMRGETWMQSVAKEFNQPATAFVWPIVIDHGVARWGRKNSSSSSISDDDLGLSYPEESSAGPDSHGEVLHYAIRFFTCAGIEVEKSAHANLAAASVLFSWYYADGLAEERRRISFHSIKDRVVQSSLVSPSTQISSDEENSVQIAIDYPWRTVDPMPPGPEGQGAVLAMLRRSFFRAWSVAAKDEKEDLDTDELAFSLSIDHVHFVGVTNDGEDLFIELSPSGFNMMSGKTVDYDALKAGLNGKGVIICCEVPEKSPGDFLQGHVESDGVNGQGLPDDIRIDFCSRYFQPSFSSEDPVSGWPHCALGPWFGARRGKERVVGLQSSDRGGLVECILKESEQKVCIVGSAVTTIAGKTLMRA